jgi:hypothetical protein
MRRHHAGTATLLHAATYVSCHTAFCPLTESVLNHGHQLSLILQQQSLNTA